MKKKILIALTLILAVLMASCKTASQPPLPIHSGIEQMLEAMDYEDCHILQLGNYRACKHLPQEVGAQEADLAMKKYFNQNPPIRISDKKVMEEGDLAIISYEITAGTQTVMKVKKEVVKGGIVNFDSQIEQSVVGKTVGQAYTIPHQLGVCKITLQYIYTVDETAQLDDEYVRSHLDYSSMAEWKAAILKDLEAQKNEEAWQQSLRAMIAQSTFDLSEECLAEKAEELARQEQKKAVSEGWEWEEYLSEELEWTEKQFELDCSLRARQEVQEYLLVGAIAAKESFASGQGYEVLRQEVYNIVCTAEEK